MLRRVGLGWGLAIVMGVCWGAFPSVPTVLAGTPTEGGHAGDGTGRSETAVSREVVAQLLQGVDSETVRHNVFTQGTHPQIRLVFLSSEGSIQPPAIIGYEVRDFWGNMVTQGRTPLNVVPGLGGNVTLTPDVRETGWYRIHMELKDADGPIAVRYQATPGQTSDKTREKESVVTFAIVPDRPRGWSATPTPFALDAATSWLVQKDHYRTLADLMRLAGVTWGRDRLSWSEVQASRESAPSWGRYDESANAQKASGIRILQVFHDSPGWTRKDGTTKLPEDLMAVYHFAQAAAEHFKDSVFAWEVWNEEDIGFSTEPADQYAAVMKAAALGFRQAAARPLVALGPLALEPGEYGELLAANGIAPYVDIYSFHTYSNAATADYESVLRNHIRFAREHGMVDQQLWITESGRAFARGPVTSFDAEAQAQVEYLLKAYTKSLALGVDRFFWFVLPHYMENGIQFGILRADLTPLPAYSALATLTSVLGQGRYVGQASVGGATAYVFDSGSEKVAVVWSDRDEEVILPAGEETPTVINAMGGISTPTRDGDLYRVQVDRIPLFLAGVDCSAWPLRGPAEIGQEPLLPSESSEARPAVSTRLSSQVAAQDANLSIVLVNRFPPDTLPPNRKSPPLGYLIVPGKPIDFTVEAYNFSDTEVQGTLRVTLPEGFQSQLLQTTLSIPAMDKTEATFRLIPPDQPIADTYLLRVEGVFGGREVTPAVSKLLVDSTKVARTIGLAEAVSIQLPHWGVNVSANGTSTINQTAEQERSGVGEFIHCFPQVSDRWAYSVLDFGQPVDLRGYTGIRFRIVTDQVDPRTLMRVMLDDASGSTYFASVGYPLDQPEQELTFLFKDLSYLGNWFGTRSDGDGTLDLSRVRRIQFGCNTTSDRVSYQIREVQLIKVG